MQQGKFTRELIAPCGMNCGICTRYLAYSRGIPEEKGRLIHCQGCLSLNNRVCFIKKGCKKLLKKELLSCCECETIPCNNLDRLDKRYRKQYGMSMIENLKTLKEKGMTKFLETEETKHQCPQCSDIISIHDRKCYTCGYKRSEKLWRINI